MKGESIVYKMPTDLSAGGSNVEFIGKGTKSTSLFTSKVSDKAISTIRNVEAVAAKSIPAPKVNLPKSPTQLENFNYAPTYVGGLGKSTSKYEGLGQYEVSTGGGSIVKSKSEVKYLVKQESINNQNLKTNQNLKVIQINKQSPIEVLKTNTKAIETQAIKTNLDTTQMLKLNLKTNQAQKLNQMQKQSLRQTQQTKQTQKPFTPKTPITFGFKTPSKSGGSAITKKLTSEDIFTVLGKRFGKDTELFKTSNKAEAEGKLFSFLKGTLGRSGKIEKGGKALSFGELDMFKSGEFRPAKRDTTRIVQKAKYSLGTRAETKEIQYFKKKKEKGGFKWML